VIETVPTNAEEITAIEEYQSPGKPLSRICGKDRMYTFKTLHGESWSKPSVIEHGGGAKLANRGELRGQWG